MNKQSNLYAEITIEQIQFLYKKTMNTSGKVEASLLSGGLFNTTYHVWSRECGLDTVLRLGPVNRHLLMRFEENLMEAETYVYELCRQAQIACSEVLLCDTSKKWIDRDFMIVAYIPSIAMSQSGMTQEQKISLYVDAGKLAKKMHGIANHTFGRVSEILTGLSFSRWSEYLSSELEDILSRLIRDDGVEPEKAAGAQRIIVKYRDWLDEITTPRLVHTDLWEGNILLEENNKQQIAAIIDSDRALFGDPDYDLACPWMMNDAYLRGYGLEENSFHDEAFNSPKRTARRKIYLVLYRFLEAYVGLSEYNNQDLYENSLRDAFRIVEELMSE